MGFKDLGKGYCCSNIGTWVWGLGLWFKDYEFRASIVGLGVWGLGFYGTRIWWVQRLVDLGA